jgi:hypothetical protein
MGRVFTIVNVFKGPPSSYFLPYFCPLAFGLCETLISRALFTAIVVTAVELLPPTLDPRHCMGKKKSSSKLKEVLVDEEASLSIIKNHDFIAIRASKKVWPSPSMTEDQLRDLVGDGLIQEQGFADWKTPGQYWVPALNLGEIVLFVSFVRAGLCLPASSFLHHFL